MNFLLPILIFCDVITAAFLCAVAASMKRNNTPRSAFGFTYVVIALLIASAATIANLMK